jgi:hypothetical protein
VGFEPEGEAFVTWETRVSGLDPVLKLLRAGETGLPDNSYKELDGKPVAVVAGNALTIETGLLSSTGTRSGSRISWGPPGYGNPLYFVSCGLVFDFGRRTAGSEFGTPCRDRHQY